MSVPSEGCFVWLGAPGGGTLYGCACGGLNSTHLSTAFSASIPPASSNNAWFGEERGAGMGFPGGSEGKESACNAEDLGSIPGSGRSPGEGNDYPLQYSCLENPMDRGVWQATACGIAKSHD